MAFTGDYLRVAPIELSLLGCDSLITCSPLVRLGDKGETVIRVKIHNAPDYLDLNNVGLSFEANVGGKLIQDENMKRFRVIDKTTFEYLCADEVHSFVGTINTAYFVLTQTNRRVTTQNMTIHSLPNAEQGTTGLKDHYVSVIDDLLVSNAEAIKKAQEIEDMINKNQVVKKSGDTMTGDLVFDRPNGANSLLAFGTGVAGKRNYIYGGKDILGAYSDESGQLIWKYTPSTKTFDLNATNSNLVKKTGDTMTGHLAFDTRSSEKVIRSATGDGTFGAGISLNNRGLNLVDWSNGANILDWESATRTLTLANGVVNTNILKKSDVYSDWILPGGTPKVVPNGVDMNTITESGIWQANSNPNLPNTGGQWFVIEVIRHTNSYVIQRATRFANSIPETYVRTLNGGTWGSWQTILGGKDGQVNLTLTADATSPDPNYLLSSTRRGNAVTLKGAITLNSNATGQIIATVPADMRPIFGNISTYVPSIDGSVAVQVFINGGNGNIALSSNAKGKRVDFCISYVVN
ncbi:pyocin knob domain-containing protein [Bacillus wiedmannii]|uniref:pyocin knob domain-containing protein n=1 Tax=Bacillus wiedmannii TaxID=1890302 RepID=UPI000BEF6BD8|nr:pyocin knob domain-containing protein [Bacillus wiedmannii]PEO38300.1 hypothetical protein CN555_13915 [Bacillus wiedmannii]